MSFENQKPEVAEDQVATTEANFSEELSAVELEERLEMAAAADPIIDIC